MSCSFVFLRCWNNLRRSASSSVLSDSIVRSVLQLVAGLVTEFNSVFLSIFCANFCLRKYPAVESFEYGAGCWIFVTSDLLGVTCSIFAMDDLPSLWILLTSKDFDFTFEILAAFLDVALCKNCQGDIVWKPELILAVTMRDSVKVVACLRPWWRIYLWLRQ